MANLKKQSQVEKIATFIKEFPNFTLFKFEKTTHTSLESLRKNLRKSGAKVMVIKNSLLQKAVNKLSGAKGAVSLKEIQKSTRAIADKTAMLGFGPDWGAGMNAFNEFSKADKSVAFKVGILDGTTYGQDDLVRISGLPSREVLVGKLLGSMKSPVSHFTHALKFNMQKFVYILNAKAKAG